MLAIRVDKNGNFDVTTRWNHEHGGDVRLSNNYGELESLFDFKDIKKIIKPKTDVITVDNFEKIKKIADLRLKCEIPHHYIFNGIYHPTNGYGIVSLLNKENLVNSETNEYV